MSDVYHQKWEFKALVNAFKTPLDGGKVNWADSN
jgi:hypothetical protein